MTDFSAVHASLKYVGTMGNERLELDLPSDASFTLQVLLAQDHPAVLDLDGELFGTGSSVARHLVVRGHSGLGHSPPPVRSVVGTAVLVVRDEPNERVWLQLNLRTEEPWTDEAAEALANLPTHTQVHALFSTDQIGRAEFVADNFELTIDWN